MPNSPSHITGWMSVRRRMRGALYHFLRSRFVSAQRPWSGLSLTEVSWSNEGSELRLALPVGSEGTDAVWLSTA